MGYITVKQAVDDEELPFTSEPSLRNYIHRADECGLSPHIKRVGAKVLLDKEGLKNWIDDGVPVLSTNARGKSKNKGSAKIIQILTADHANFIYGLSSDGKLYQSNGTSWHLLIDGLPEEEE